MAFTKDSGRQYVLSAVVEGTYTDFPVGTADKEIINLPAGAVVVGGWVECDATYATATSPTITLEIDNAGLHSASNLTAGTGVAITPTGTKLSAANTVDVTIGGSGSAATAGSWRVIVNYIVVERSNETQN